MNTIQQKAVLIGAAATLFAGGAVCAPAQSAPASSATAHTSKCGLAEQSTNDKGQLVIVAQCGGDLPGVLTLVVNDPNAASLTGEWALNVSYTQPLHPGAAPTDSTDPDSGAGEELVQKGVITGVITSGTAGLLSGKVSTLNSMQLGLAGGSMQFANMNTNGSSGTVSASNLDDRIASSTTVTLTF